jgi:hypothetical protein
MDNGHILLSTDSDATLGGLNFTDNDLVEYDPDSDTATLYFDGSTTTLTSDIDAVHVLENGHIVLSTKDDASLGGLSFKDGDLVDYDPVNDTAVLYFAEALFSAAEDVRSVHIGPGSGGNSVTLPIAHWKLDETSGPTAVDSEGGHDGTLAGNPTWSTGALDGALDFDGSGDRIDVGSILDGGSPQISVTAWIFKRDTGDDRVISKSSGTAIPDHIFSLGLYGTTIRVRLRTTDNGGTSNYDGGAISLDQWVHVAFTYDGAQLRIYRDGTETASYAVTGDMIASTQDIAIGNVNATDNRYWNGLLDDVRIYDTDLSASEVAELANPDSVTGPIAHWKLDETSGTTAVDSEGGHDGALTNGPVWIPGTIDGGLDFDGLNDRVSVGTIDVSGSGLTMMGWFNAETIPTSDGRIISKADGPNASDAWWQLSTTDSGSNRYIRMRIKAGGTTTTLADSSVNLTTNQWYFAAATYDNASAAMKLYLDGAEVASATHAVGGAVDTGPTVPVAIGANGTLERFFDGVLDDIRIYNRALNATEISDLFTSGGGGGGGPDPGGCNGTFRDEFDIKEYDQNNGTLNWSTNWEETGETTNPTGGDIRIDDDVSNYQLQVRDDGQTISREADLSGAGSATLSFDYRRESLNGSGDYVAVEVSYNGGTDWTELDRFTGTADDGSYTSSSHVLDAGSLSANTRIRFLTPNSGMNNNNMVWFDNIQIQCAP